MLELPPLPAHVGTLTDHTFRQVVASNATLASPFPCRTCGARRIDEPRIFRWLDEHDQPADYRCDCIAQYKLAVNLASCGIPRLYQRMRWADLDAVPQAVMDRVERYLDALEDRVLDGRGLLFHGPVGTGKSSLTYLLAKRIFAAGFDVYAVPFQEFIDLYTSTWGGSEEARSTKEWFEQRIRSAPVLVLDDLAREYGGRSKVVESLLDHVVRFRVQNQLPLLLSSNQNLAGLSAAYSINFASLLTECTEIIEVVGEDYRERARVRAEDEQDNYLRRPVML